MPGENWSCCCSVSRVVCISGVCASILAPVLLVDRSLIMTGSHLVVHCRSVERCSRCAKPVMRNCKKAGYREWPKDGLLLGSAFSAIAVYRWRGAPLLYRAQWLCRKFLLNISIVNTINFQKLTYIIFILLRRVFPVSYSGTLGLL